MSDPAGPSPRISLPSFIDLHPDDPRRHASLIVTSIIERVASSVLPVILERITPLMSALEDLTTAINEEVDQIAIAVQQIANHGSVRADGQLTSLAQRIRNSTQSLKDAIAQANASGDVSGTDPNAPTTVPGGQSSLGADRGTTAMAGGGFGGLGASAGTPVGPTDRDQDPNAGLDVGARESASSNTGSASSSETLLNPDNPSPQAGTPTGPGSEKAGGSAGSSQVKP